MAPSDRPTFLKMLELVNLTARPFGRLYARRYKITLSEWRVLFTVEAHPDISAAEIADALGLDKMTVSRAVRALERVGRIRREAHIRDQRRATLRLTAKGRTIFDKIAPSARSREAALFGALNDNELRAFKANLDKLIARVRNLPETADNA